VIAKALTACANAGQNVADHLVDVNRMVELGSGSQCLIEYVAHHLLMSTR